MQSIWFLVFFDDILVYNKSYAEHLVHLEQVLRVLLQEHWRVKLSKCSFAQRYISYPGFVISEHVVSTCADKGCGRMTYINICQGAEKFFGAGWVLQKICSALWCHF
jgi:hypothetical protein